MTDKRKALYNPKTGKIGSVLLQAGYGLSRCVAQVFDTKDWELAPTDGQEIMEATMDQWKLVAAMDREARVDRFARLSA